MPDPTNPPVKRPPRPPRPPSTTVPGPLPADWLTEGDAARLAGVSPRTIQRWATAGLPRYGKPKRPMYRATDLAAYLDSRGR